LPGGALVTPLHTLYLDPRIEEVELLPVCEHDIAPAPALVELGEVETLGFGGLS
jgi:hypothetical protein